MLVDRDAAALDAVAGDIRGKVTGAQVLTILSDVSQDPQARRIVEETHAKFGRIDVLVNNAGVREYWRLADAPAESWQNILSVNLLSYAFMAKAAFPALRQSGSRREYSISTVVLVAGISTPK